MATSVWGSDAGTEVDGFSSEADWTDYLEDAGRWVIDQITGPSPAERLARIMASAPPAWRTYDAALQRMSVQEQRRYAERAVGHVHFLEPQDLHTTEMVARYIACCEVGCTGGGVESPCVDAANDLRDSGGLFGGGGDGGVNVAGVNFEWPPNAATVAVLIVIGLLVWQFFD